MVVCLFGCLLGWVARLLGRRDCLVGRSVAWLFGGLFVRLFGWSGWPRGCCVALPLGCLVVWLLGCLAVWLVGLVGSIG